ncbi:LysM peptidoglycan-binding domain-containing protein [Phenylobacterium sp.]|jgi:murein DD-endopeptidase MepM/ murein hydrolase activator NlpD|uniref:LysM peptidoglycan-binding domain-containing protein n=1 Tax=Phenylobacterium sp. TaxID=1871053 RepID=UPI002F9234A1
MTNPLKRTLLILAAGGALSAYAGAAQAQLRPNFPTRLDQLPGREAQPAPAQEEEAPAVTPPAAAAPAPRTAAVESRPLAPPPAARRIVQPAEPDEPAPRTQTQRSVTGRVVEVDGRARTYEVKKGDTLTSVARKLDTTVEQLRKDNKLKGSAIQPGDELKGPKTSAKAYVVGSGDTLSAVARRFGVTAEALREENDLSRDASLKAGQRLRLPSGYRDRGPITTTTRVTAEEAAPRATRASPSRPQRTSPVEQQEDDGPRASGPTRRTVTGRVVDVDGPARSYTVRKGDTLEEIADKLDTTVSALKKDNRLKGSTIRPGQTLKGPRTEAKAYVAGEGDTLAAISRRFGVSVNALRSANGLGRNAQVRPGQRIRLPSGYRDRGPITVEIPATTPRLVPPMPQPAEQRPTPPPLRTEEPAPALPSRPQPYAPTRPVAPPVQTVPRTPPATSSGGPPAAPIAAPPPTDAAVSAMGRGRFIWPLRGDVISDFGPKAAGQRNDGINIRTDAGTPVRAAAAGEVVYAGDQVPGFGNLVLIKHEDGWVTAYGHLARVEVKMQQKVTQGQQVGQAGSSGGVAEPQLHFEVRYAPRVDERARPVDPTLVLPR